MNSPQVHAAQPTPSAVPLLVIAWVRAVAQALQAAARAFDGWVATRQRRSDDNAVLAAMTDHERRDIGLPPKGRPAGSTEGWIFGFTR